VLRRSVPARLLQFPVVPVGIAWSSINAPTDLYVGANPSDAMFETAPGKVQVYYVVPGRRVRNSCSAITRFSTSRSTPKSAEARQRQFSDAVERRRGTGAAAGVAGVDPLRQCRPQQRDGDRGVRGLLPAVQHQEPDRFSLASVQQHPAIAVPNADGQFNERYAYVLNGDGTLSVGKYNLERHLRSDTPKIGWVPWSGVGASHGCSLECGRDLSRRAISASASAKSSTIRAIPRLRAAGEQPAGRLHAVARQGPLAVSPADGDADGSGHAPLGDYQIDVDGKIVPQNNGGENLRRRRWLRAAWTMTSSRSARTRRPAPMSAAHGKNGKSQIRGMGDAFRASSWPAVLWQAHQDIAGARNGDEHPSRFRPTIRTTMRPCRRPTAKRPKFIRPPGTTFDPRAAIIKDTPGAMMISELVIECTA
jgi:hypothetical protein